jgi:hypothetical protein
MGKTAFSGPVYGAKSLLYGSHRENFLITSTVTETEAKVVVPAYEDWLVTEFSVFRGSSGSTAVNQVFGVDDDSTTIANVVTASSAAGIVLSTTLATTPGEYEGTLVLGGSTLSLQSWRSGSSVAPCSNVTFAVYGYIRFKTSTRAEG